MISTSLTSNLGSSRWEGVASLDGSLLDLLATVACELALCSQPTYLPTPPDQHIARGALSDWESGGWGAWLQSKRQTHF